MEVPVEEQLQGLLRRARTFDRLYFYNKEQVCPYMLASHGFAIIVAQQSDGQVQCRCCFCNHSIRFDRLSQNYEVKDQLKEALNDHRETCQGQAQRKVKEYNNKLIFEHGSLIYNWNLESYKGSKTFLKLNWRDVEKTLQIGLNDQTVNLVVKMLEQVDSSIANNEKITKIKSSLMCCIYGWRLEQMDFKTVANCIFCNATVNVSQYTEIIDETKQIDRGFAFRDYHRAWCSITSLKFQHWKLILKKLAYDQLPVPEDEFSKTQMHIFSRQIQTNLIKAYKKYYLKLNAMKKDIDLARQKIRNAPYVSLVPEDQREQSEERISQLQFEQSYSLIANSLTTVQENMEALIKRIKVQ